MTEEQPEPLDLPSKQELKYLNRLPAEAQARISLEGTKAEAEFHSRANGNNLLEHGDDYDPGTVEDKKYRLMRMCDRLTHRVLRSYFQELKVLPIPPGTIRRLLYYILANVSIRLYQAKWRQYIPPDPSESEPGFLGAAVWHQQPLIEEYYTEALRIHEQRLSEYLRTGLAPKWPVRRPEPPSPRPETVHPDPERLIEGKQRVGISTAARYLGLSHDHVRRLVQMRKLDRLGQGRPVQVTTASLKKYKGT